MTRHASTYVQFFLTFLSIGMLTACLNNSTPQGWQIANPASVYCVRQGGQAHIIRDASGAEQGFCRLQDGSLTDEREYFRSRS